MSLPCKSAVRSKCDDERHWYERCPVSGMHQGEALHCRMMRLTLAKDCDGAAVSPGSDAQYALPPLRDLCPRLTGQVFRPRQPQHRPWPSWCPCPPACAARTVRSWLAPCPWWRTPYLLPRTTPVTTRLLAGFPRIPASRVGHWVGGPTDARRPKAPVLRLELPRQQPGRYCRHRHRFREVWLAGKVVRRRIRART